MYNDRHRGKSGLPAQKRQMVMAQRTHASEETPIVKTVLLSSLFGVLASVLSGGTPSSCLTKSKRHILMCSTFCFR